MAVIPPPPHGTAAEPRAVAERRVEVGAGHNTIMVSAAEHTWISVLGRGIELMRESGGGAEATFTVPPGSYLVRCDGALNAVEAEDRPVPVTPFDPASARAGTTLVTAEAGALETLQLTADTPDRHQADGMGELRADGSSFCTVTVTGPADEVFLRATGGTIMAADGKARIREVRLESGRAEFRFVSETSPKLVTLYAFTADPRLHAELSVEFV
jgi:hypothetical protein